MDENEEALNKLQKTFKHLQKDLILQLEDIMYNMGDLSDIGNEIGIVIEKYIQANKKEFPGFTIDDFNKGIEHGRSLTNGTH